MADSRLRRVRKEIEDVQRDPVAGVDVWLLSDDLTHLKGRFSGPFNTPYDEGTFIIDILLPPTYPFTPPKMKFDTPVYHPNISSQTGAICLDILKDQWTPVMTLKSALISLQSLLSTPEPADPQDAEVAAHCLRDRKGFDETARYWTEVYASKEQPVEESSWVIPDGVKREAVRKLVEMGFRGEGVVRALQNSNGNEDLALEALLTGG